MQILDAAGQLPDQAMGPHAGIMNEGLESFAGGGARGDDVMGAMPMLPPLGKLFGMAGRLRGAGGAYQGTQPIAGSQGIPHTSPLPNQGPPVMGGAPPSGGGYADDAAGLMRGDIPLEKPRLGADFQAMDDLVTPQMTSQGGAVEANSWVGEMLGQGYGPQDIIEMAQGAGFHPGEIASVMGMPWG